MKTNRVYQKRAVLPQIFTVHIFERLPHSKANRERTAFFPKELIILPAKQGKGKTARVKN